MGKNNELKELKIMISACVPLLHFDLYAEIGLGFKCAPRGSTPD